ncbi:MAG: hypothetical protein WKG07_35060 [Hymenobacter sp.]
MRRARRSWLGSLSAAALHQLFAGAARDTGQVLSALRVGSPASLPLPGRLSAHYASRYHDVDSYNVVGKIAGSDAKLKVSTWCTAPTSTTWA